MYLWRKETKFSYLCIEPQKVGVNLVLVNNSDEIDLLTALSTNSVLGSSGKMRIPSPSCPYYFAGAA